LGAFVLVLLITIIIFHFTITFTHFKADMRHIFIIAITAITVLLSGCATVSGSSPYQSISVQTFAADGSEITGVKCDMTNDEGTWFAQTPGSANIHRSNKDLQVICRKAGVDVGTANVVSRTKGNMWGNIILGGGIGAVVDHNNGTAYEYPGLIKVFMGRSNQRIENLDADSVQASNNQTSTPNSPAQTTSLSLDDAKLKCIELGFKPATESFGNCVLKLAK
jgi:hypothetical protein